MLDIIQNQVVTDYNNVSALDKSAVKEAFAPIVDGEVKEENSVRKGIPSDSLKPIIKDGIKEENSIVNGITKKDVHQETLVNQQKLAIKETPPNSVSRNPLISMEIKEEENKEMAEVTQTDIFKLSEEHSDIRREAVDHTNEIVKEGLKGDYNTLNAIKDSRFETVTRVENSADRLEKGISDTNFNLSSRVENANDRITKDVGDFRSQTADRFFQVARDTADLRAQVTQVLSETRLVGANTAKDNEIAVLRNTIENQKNTQYLSDKITSDGDKTRALVNELKYGDLNRELIERQSKLTCCECHKDDWHWGRFHHWLDGNNQYQSQYAAQMAALQNQMQNFNSQLSETRQGIVNFGTQSGLTQASSNNNVR